VLDSCVFNPALLGANAGLNRASNSRPSKSVWGSFMLALLYSSWRSANDRCQSIWRSGDPAFKSLCDALLGIGKSDQEFHVCGRQPWASLDRFAQSCRAMGYLIFVCICIKFHRGKQTGYFNVTLWIYSHSLHTLSLLVSLPPHSPHHCSYCVAGECTAGIASWTGRSLHLTR
jgi:hypothetical protein